MKVLFPALFLIMFFSCSTKNSVDPPTTPNSTCISLPLSPESYWVYQKVQLDANKKVEKKWVDTVRSNKTFVENGNTYYSFKPFRVRNKDCNTIVFQENEFSHAEIELKNNVSEDTKVFDLPSSRYPCKSGLQVWSYKDRTRVNNYDCFRVRYRITACDGKELEIVNVYIAEGVGIVKLLQYNSLTGKRELKYIWELRSFKPSQQTDQKTTF